MATVGVIFGGRSVEHEVSVSSARTVRSGLERAGHRVVPLGIGPTGHWVDQDTASRALDGEIERLPAGEGAVLETLHHLLGAGCDVLFPIVHGTWGEDGTLQGFCEILDLPYVGADVTASALAMDKLKAKRLLDLAGLPVVDYRAADRRRFEANPAGFVAECEALGAPLFVKPSVGGSSVGVRKVEETSCLESAVRFALRFDETVVVERAVAGRELECAVLGYEALEASGVGEIIPGEAFYDYADKYLTDGAALIAPAELPPALEAEIRRLAAQAFSALGGTGMARVDFLLEGDTPFVNEINTLPGFTSISMYPRLWELAGVPLEELVDRLVDIARRRHRDRKRLDAGIKDWLAELAGRRPSG